MRITKCPCSFQRLDVKEPVKLYDIEVEDTHNYFANSVLVSNSHITLAETLPNPLFERAIRNVTGMTQEQFDGLVAGKYGVDKETHKIVDGEQEGALVGGKAFENLLGSIERDRELSETLDAIQTARGAKLDALVKKAKILRALKHQNLEPTVYLQKHIPVLPPVMRPVSIMGSGDIAYADLNEIYKGLALDNLQMQEFPKGLPDSEKNELRAELYDGMKSLIGLGGTLNKEHDLRGVINELHGTELKYGFFQKNLLKRRQDLTARGVVVPDMDLSVNEIGMPKDMAKVLFEPFVIQELTHPPYSMSVADAKLAIKNENEGAMRALEKVMVERPVAMKRDPALHKHSIQGFYTKLVSGYAIHVPPTIVEGLGMDFDGDSASLYVPISADAISEVKNMLPTNILLSPSTGRAMFLPRLESAMGLYELTKVGNPTGKTFASMPEVLGAYQKDTIGMNDVVRLNGKATTAGRVMVASVLPEGAWRDRYLHDFEFEANYKSIRQLFTDLGKDPAHYKSAIDKLSRMGFATATQKGISVNLNDFMAETGTRDKILAAADAEVSKLPKGAKDLNERKAQIYMSAADDLKDALDKKFGKNGMANNNLYNMYRSGAKMSATQLRQILGTPLVIDGPGGPMPYPIRHSYSEGLDAAEYWTAAHGARKVGYEKVQEVSIPGALNKQFANLAMGYTVTEKDCGTSEGISRPIDAPDLLDRTLAEPIKLKSGRTLSRGTVIDTAVLGELKKSKRSTVMVRTPMRCGSHKGVCSKCYGRAPDGKDIPVGTNVGILASQAIGERGVQLTLRKFHQAGTAGQKGMLSGIGRVKQLASMPEVLPGAATLSEESGTVTKVDKDPAGGFRVWVNQKDHYVPAGFDITVRKGDKVQRGKPITTGVVNPRDLLRLNGINAVQSYIAEEFDNLYSQEGVKRVHSEMLTRALTNLGEVEDPGDNEDLLPTDTTSVQSMQAWNAAHKDKKPIRFRPILKGIDILPLEQTTDFLARLAYRRPDETLTKGVSEGWSSDIHGTHPVSGLVYGAEFGKGKEPGGY
jgi:DNA-directed RNA polymerase subunit beta'